MDLSKSFQTEILCTLISLFLWWTPSSSLPRSLSSTQDFFIRLNTHCLHNGRSCGSDFCIQKETRKLVCQANECSRFSCTVSHSFSGREGMTSLQSDLVYIEWIKNWTIYSTEGVCGVALRRNMLTQFSITWVLRHIVASFLLSWYEIDILEKLFKGKLHQFHTSKCISRSWGTWGIS